MRIAINGFGRIGKTLVRSILNDARARKNLEIVVINVGPADADQIAYMFKYDTILGTFPGDVSYTNKKLLVDGLSIDIVAELDVEKFPWKKFEIDWVVDATGKFTEGNQARKHIDAGARNVLITAPADGEDVAIIPGVNDGMYDAQKHRTVSLGSCTTNALLPTLAVLHEAFGIERAIMTTVHAYTNTQALLDVNAVSSDPRRSRAAALNIVPSSTGATSMVAKIIPELGDRVSGSSLRVPVGIVSWLEVTAQIKKTVSAQELNALFKSAASGKLKNILAISDEPLVSSDYQQSPYSITIDARSTASVGTLVKVCGWYDNEYGYSCRLKDFLDNSAARR